VRICSRGLREKWVRVPLSLQRNISLTYRFKNRWKDEDVGNRKVADPHFIIMEKLTMKDIKEAIKLWERLNDNYTI